MLLVLLRSLASANAGRATATNHSQHTDGEQGDKDHDDRLTVIFMLDTVTRPLVTVFCGCAADDGGVADEEGNCHGHGVLMR